MCIACIVKCRAANQLKRKGATYHFHRAHDVVLVVSAPLTLHRHKIGNLTYAVNREKTGDEDIGFRQIELFIAHTRGIRRGNTEIAAFSRVQDRAKDAG